MKQLVKFAVGEKQPDSPVRPLEVLFPHARPSVTFGVFGWERLLHADSLHPPHHRAAHSLKFEESDQILQTCP